MRNLFERCVETPEIYVKVVTRITAVVGVLTAVTGILIIGWLRP
jgi:hypothetical protein